MLSRHLGRVSADRGARKTCQKSRNPSSPWKIFVSIRFVMDALPFVLDDCQSVSINHLHSPPVNAAATTDTASFSANLKGPASFLRLVHFFRLFLDF